MATSTETDDTVQVIIDSIPTKLCCYKKTANYLIFATQTEGVPVSGKIIPTGSSPDGEALSYRFVSGDNIFSEVAEIIAYNLKIDRPTTLCLSLKDYGPSALMDLVDALEYTSDMFD